jgi:hypothetical protein
MLFVPFLICFFASGSRPLQAGGTDGVDNERKDRRKMHQKPGRVSRDQDGKEVP